MKARLAAGLALVISLETSALQVSFQGDRLTLKARQDDLHDVLDLFTHAGVRVRVDPTIRATVSGDIEDEDVVKALDRLLEKFSYVVIWDVIEGPLGSIPRLSEIQIFKPELGRERAEPLEEPGGNLRVTTGPTGQGPLFVQDEILLRVKGGVKFEDLKRLLREIGGSIISSIPRLGIYRVRLPPGTNVLALIEQLKQNPLMAEVEPNFVAGVPSPVAAGTAAGEPAEPTIKRIAKGAPPVAVLDSGLLSSAGLDPYIVGRLDALDPDRPLTDRAGHGTQMAMIASGLIAPYGIPDPGIEGIPVVAVRAFDDNGYASNYSVMRSLDYALSEGARVINLSWGTDTDSKFMRDAMGYAQSKGAIVVASAGNEPTGKAVYPAAYPGVIGVTALTEEGGVWSQSNYGDFADVAAPGKANFPIGHKGPAGAYAGTSIASAYVSYELSRYFAANPTASSSEAVNALNRSLTDAGANGKDPYYGNGALDASAISKLHGAD